MSEKPLDQFEASVRRLVEGSFSRIFGGRLDAVEISAELIRVAQAQQVDGTLPDQFEIELNPTDYTFWHENRPTLAQELEQIIVEYAKQGQTRLINWPHVELMANTGLGRNQLAVHAAHSAELTAETGVLHRETDAAQIQTALTKLDAFLIVGGKTHVALNQPLLTIGRRASNDIVVDVATVSRRHAQLRWRFGRFILFDLGSRGGTFVNGRRVDECVLNPGDMITLSETTLIYGEGLDETRRVPRSDRSHDDATQLINPVRLSGKSD